MINLLLYWSHISLIILITFVPGLAVALRIKYLNSVERLAVSFGFSFLIALILTPFFALKFDLAGRLLFAVIMVISLFYIVRNRSEIKFDRDLRFILLVLLLSLVTKFFLQTLWEYPVIGGDWFGHTFVRPYRFETGDWMPDRDRTPLFNLLIYIYHNLLGSSLYQYWVSQIISVTVNSVFIIPAYLIGKRAFGDRVAEISALFMLVTPFLIFNTIYTWPKNAAMYGVLIMIYFLFFSEHDIKLRYTLAGLFAGIGFLFHNYAALYIGIAFLLLIYTGKMHRDLALKNIFSNLKRLSYFLLIILIVLLPYFAWVYSYYGTISTSKFIYYPFAVKGYDSAISGDEHEIFNDFYSTPIKEIIMTRVTNAIVTLTPAALPVDPVAINLPTYDPIYYYSHDYPGALSTLMYLVVVVWFIKYALGKRKTEITIVSFIIFAFLINLFLWGWREWGLVNQMLHPTVPLLILLGFSEVLAANDNIKNILVYIIFIGSFAENLIYGTLIGKFYLVEGGLNGINIMAMQYISGFQISDFISAHFLLSNPVDYIVNFLFLIAVIIAVVIALIKLKVVSRKDIS